jgi:hypothetical protein
MKPTPLRTKKDPNKKKPLNLSLLTPPKKDFDITSSGTFSIPEFQTKIQIGTSGIKNETHESPSTKIDFLTDFKFKSNEIIGKGASASVIRAKYSPKEKSRRSDRFVEGTVYALKKVPLYQKNSAKIIMEEIKQLYATASCPFVVDFFEAFYREGAIHILLEYMELGSLEDMLTVCPIPEPVLAEMSFQVIIHIHLIRFIDFEGTGVFGGEQNHSS